MRNVTIRGLLAHKLRLLLTALAIILGVTFISGTFVLTDTLHDTFTALFSNIYSKIDFQVRGVAQFGKNTPNAVRDPIPESLLATVRGVPGVEAADGTVSGYAQFVGRDGKAIQTGGAPTLGVNYNASPQLSVLRIIAGGPPAAGYPNVKVQTRSQFEQSQVSSVNQLLGLVYALLGLAVIIALIGIVNTLMLSVLERTREIGLLRAVGMRRRQVRSMIRSEAVILAIFGAIIGIVVGTGMGLALVSALRQQGITDTVVPVSNLVIFIVLAAVLGLVAAVWPARRAARMDVLAAIAAE